MKQIFPILAVLAALLVFAIKFLPWWASLILLSIGIAGVRWGTKHVLKRIFIVPFKMKGKALAGATVKVHGFTSAPVPSSSRYEDEEVDAETHQRYQQLEWFYLDVSITPPENREECGFALWEPGELLLVPMDVKAKELENGFDSDACEIYDRKILVADRFMEDEECKYEGAQRLQLHIGVLPNIHQLQFQYYFELFGQVGLPVTVRQ
jgi:hypothetical protein